MKESLLQQGSLPEAVRTEMEVLKSLALAIEYFRMQKTLINIALQSQNQLVIVDTTIGRNTGSRRTTKFRRKRRIDHIYFGTK